MGSVVNFADALRAIIEAGEAIEGTAVRVIADSGAEIGEGVKFTVLGGNGVGATVTAMTKTSGTSALSSGLAFLSIDVGLAGAAIAPALGAVAGVALYNLSPTFWDTVSNALLSAGQTIGGKVIAWWDGHNMYLSDTTIETFKNALIDAGMFEYLSALENMTIDGVTYPPVPTSALPWTGVQYIDEIGASMSGVDPVEFTDPIYMWACGDSSTPNVYNIYAVSRSPFTVNQWNRHGGNYNSNVHESIESMYNNQKFYTYYFTVGRGWLDTGIGNTYTMPENGNIDVVNYIIAYNGQPLNLDNLQNGAKYPSSGEQFPLTYPDWYPFNYPDIGGANFPDVFPLKFPETYPDPYPDQDGAQDPAEENDDETYPYIIPDFPLPDPDPDPWDDQDQDDDPDDGEDDPDDIPDDPAGDTPDDPVDPNPDDPVTPIIPDPTLPDTVTSSRLFTVYSPSSTNLNSLGTYLWDSSLMASLRDIWQDPLDGIISLIQVFATPTTSGSQNIILGYLDSGVSAPVVSSQFVTVDCGSVAVKENKGNSTDYAPYTSLHLFLPFIGVVELDSSECMNSTINVVYKVDVYTGTCLAQVKVTRTKDMPNSPILYTYSGNCAQQIPLTSGNATGVLSALVGGVTAGLSVASGGGLGVLAGASIAGQSLTHDMFHVNHSGNISANAGIMGNKKPYLIIGRRHGYDANNYNTIYGFPANKTIILGNHTGYVKVKKCFLKTSATKHEHDEIMSLLREGVIL